MATAIKKDDIEKAKERYAKEGPRLVYVQWPANHPDRISIITDKTRALARELKKA